MNVECTNCNQERNVFGKFKHHTYKCPVCSQPITTEEFDNAVRSLVEEMGSEEILDIPGVYEIVAEYFNNEAINEVNEKRVYSRRRPRSRELTTGEDSLVTIIVDNWKD